MTERAHKDPRSRGRELAVAVLCHLEARPGHEWREAIAMVLDQAPRGDAPGEAAFAELVADPEVRKHGSRLLEHVEDHLAEIDGIIRDASRRWRLERMDQVDRNVIRLATAELLRTRAVPKAVIVSQAVWLAGRYGSERSVAFVNGVVETIAHKLRPDEGGEAAGGEA